MNYASHLINLDISNKCILECPRCMRQIGKNLYNRGEDITLENFEKIAKFFPEISFCGQMSDPIYHSNFLDILRISGKNCKRVIIQTNGYGKKDYWWDDAFFITSNPKVNFEWIFALDGLPYESHKYRVNQDGEKVFDIMRRGVEEGCDVTWQYIIFRYNENHIEEAETLAKSNGVKLNVVLSSRWKHGDPFKPINPNYSIDRIR